MQSAEHAVTSSENLTGRVKWFNNKVGYGFITVTDGSRSGSDIFAHHSAISVSSQQYRYLVQGEYVEFQLSPTQNGKYEFQATNICGIKSGQLMCETRNVVRNSKNLENHQTEVPVKKTKRVKSSNSTSSSPKQPTRVRGEGPRESDKQAWTVVGNNVSKEKQTYAKKVTRNRQTSQTN